MTYDVEDACRIMHDAYEDAAKGAGWETQAASRVPWDDVPEANKVTMRAAVTALLDHLAMPWPDRQAGDLDGLAFRCLCGAEPTWAITREGDVASCWACPPHLAPIVSLMQRREPGSTRLVVRAYLG